LIRTSQQSTGDVIIYRTVYRALHLMGTGNRPRKGDILRVIYELNREDIRRIICEKYEVSADKVEFCQISDIDCRIDMSATETPGKNPEIENERTEDERTEDERIEDERTEAAAPVPEPKENKHKAPQTKRERYKSSGYKFRQDVLSDKDLTDSDIIDMVSNEVTVAEVCRHYGFSEQIKYKLYKRFEKARLEGASNRNG